MTMLSRALAAVALIITAVSPAFADEEPTPESNATNAIWKAILAVGEPENSRETLLKEFKAVVEEFPGSPHVKTAKKYASILESMIREDREHKTLTDEQFQQLTPDNQARELIFQLRDQNGHQRSDPGNCNIFDVGFFTDNDTSPAHRLREMGVDAIPALIESVEDPELSRCVECWRSFTYSHNVLTVGHCCVAILEEMSGQRFFDRKYNHPISLPGTKRKIEEWWKATGRDGYHASLFKLTEIASGDSAQAARQLARVTPEAAVDAISKAMPRCHNSRVRYDLVNVAASIKSPESTLLLVAIKNSPVTDLSSWWQAISELWDRGEPNILDDIIAEWRRLHPAAQQERTGGECKEDAITSIIARLASTGSPYAIAELGKDLDTRSLTQRSCVLFAFAIVKEDHGGGLTGGGLYPRLGCCPERLSDEALQLVEQIAGASLSETKSHRRLTLNWDDHKISEPRLCDIAAYVLATRLPATYSFNLYGPLEARDERLKELERVFKSRKEHQEKQ
jgi:hypothetical protein